MLSDHNLEHLENPSENLQRLRTSLAENGVLLLVLSEERLQYLAEYRPDTNQHLYCWTPRTIANLLTRANFRVKEMRREPTSLKKLAANFPRDKSGAIRFLQRLLDSIR